MSSLLSKQDRILLTEISEELSTEEIVKYYRFDEEDMERIKKHRSDYNKIGFALYLGFIRHKGWALTENTKIPRKIIDFVAKQLELDPAEFHKYNVTSSTSFSHYKEIRKAYKYKPLESKFNLELESFMYEYIFKSEDSFYLVSTFMDECRNKKILLPSILVIEDFISKLINKMEEFSIKEINSYIHPQQIDFMDNLLESNDDNPAIITWLRFSSGKSSPEEIVEIVKKIEKIEEIGLKIDKDKIPTYMVEKYIKFGQRYDPYSLKRFTPQKRYAILSVFLINLHQELIDRMVLIHDVKVNNVFSKIRKTQEKNLKIHKKVSINAISDYVELGEYIINSENTTESTDKDTSFHFKINNGTWEKLKKSIELAKLLKENDSTDSIEMINKYYTSFRKYSPLLLKKLDITGTTEPNTKLLNAINIIKELNDSKKINLPEDVDISFTNKKWQKIINRKNGTEKRHYFELAVLNELRNKVRSGDISISGSKSYMNFEEYLVPKEQWELEKKATRLTAPISCEEYLDLAEKKLDKLLKWYSKNYKSLEEIIGEDDKIHLKRMEKTNSEESRVLSQELYKLVPKISLQDLLLEISNRGPVRKMRIYNVKHCFLLYLLNSSYFYTILSQFALHYANRVYSIDTRNQALKINGLECLTRLVSIRRLKMRKIGYIRVSSESQNLKRQMQQLNEIGMDIIYQEKISGATMDRKELQRLLEELQPGDTIFVTDLTRITRSTKDLFSLIEQIRDKNAYLKSLKDTWLELSEENPYSQFLITIMAGVNQLERDLIRTRQREGIEIAKKEGKFKGRVRKYHDNHAGMNYAVKLYHEGNMTVKEICQITNISRASLYRKLAII